MNNEKITVPEDRTLRQPATAFCRNPECLENGKRFLFEIEHDNPACPKCGANRQPMIGLIVLTHLLVRDKSGPVEGHGGLRYSLACNTPRAYLATATNLEAATDSAELYNCPGCAQSFKKQANYASQGATLHTEKVLEGFSYE